MFMVFSSIMSINILTCLFTDNDLKHATMESDTNTTPTVQPTVSSLELILYILYIERSADNKARSGVLPFKDTQWEAVERAAQLIDDKSQISRTVDVIQRLPTSPAETDGYHVSCYKNFTAVSS